MGHHINLGYLVQQPRLQYLSAKCDKKCLNGKLSALLSKRIFKFFLGFPTSVFLFKKLKRNYKNKTYFYHEKDPKNSPIKK